MKTVLYFGRIIRKGGATRRRKRFFLLALQPIVGLYFAAL